MIGIIGAMEEEVNQLKAAMEEVSVETKASMDFCRGRLSGKDIVVVRSGIGKVNAGICTQILADLYSVNAVINTGIAGSLHAQIDIGDIVLSTDVLQHDVDAVAFGYPVGQIPRMESLSFQADRHLADCAEKCCQRVNPDIKTFKGRVLSGDQFVADKEKKEWLIKTFGGLCTEMEGAAIGQASYLNGIPFLIVRAISDKADDSASMDYPAFEAKAISHTVALVKDMVGHLELV
ncbi:5'-methylthioadenosine/adenosylhomocysteine nucleosidase [Qiania dongpingensis]|uniref:adenosylhomocysteine nucleosidase n=1 Tax=Qiania dongpingensis TaxID=2763669 RepID=A0A7G9G189_9FIRM|nr:5'-methylthioadenosine/adenosylhomocysteine nucleosidase [Qiania dongpingensis]QNM04571.1 5'-methylthioadenosine/adenosylhomocysteine nucleosidase [Qiania dongpingensis]